MCRVRVCEPPPRRTEVIDLLPSTLARYSSRPGCRVIGFQSKLKWVIVTSISPERRSDGRGRLHLAEVNLYGWLAYTFKYTSNSPHTHTLCLTLNHWLHVEMRWEVRWFQGYVCVTLFNLNNSVMHTHVSELIQYNSSPKNKTFQRMLVTKQLMVAIDFNIIVFNTMEVNGNRQLFGY